MFRDLVNKGKIWADRVANAVLNYSEVEARVREATNDEAWGPPSNLMKQISEYTYIHSCCLEVMTVLWKRIHVESSFYWRRVYKSLLLLDYLLKNGSEQVASSAREHIYDLRTLEAFQYFEENGKDQGINVRIRVQDIIDLLQDPERLKKEREKAKAQQHIAIAAVSSKGFGPGFTQHNSLSPTDQRVYHHHCSKDASTDQLPAKPRLGSIDEWHVGRERGAVDDVVEQVKEAWGTFKLSTKDLFGNRDSDVSTYENNPRVVSEEVYTFPDDVVDADATELPEATYSPPRTRKNTDDWEQRSGTNKPSGGTEAKVNIQKPPKEAEQTKPKPPSVDLITGSWNDDPSPPSKLVDFDLIEPADETVWTRTAPTPSESLWPTESFNGTKSNSNNNASNSLLDTDFGDFISAKATTERQNGPVPSKPFVAVTTPNLGPAQFSNDLLSEPVVLFNAPTLNPSNNATTNVLPTRTEPKSPDPPKPIQLGETWRELNNLRIDLDKIAMPTKMGDEHSNRPTLRQLQQNQSEGTATKFDPFGGSFTTMQGRTDVHIR